MKILSLFICMMNILYYECRFDKLKIAGIQMIWSKMHFFVLKNTNSIIFFYDFPELLNISCCDNSESP